MRIRFFTLFLILFVNEYAFSQNKVNLSSTYSELVSNELKPFYTPSKGLIEELLKGEVISVGKVDSPTSKEQQMMLFVSGIHPRNCKRAMRKLSLYENYHQYMDFIKSSTYDEKMKQFTFTVDHTLLPFAMVVKFKIPRIEGEGVYPFTFEEGFLKDLKGNIQVKKMANHCLLSLKADWRGPETKIPDLIFGTFLQTVGKIGLEHLIRVSLF